MRPICFDCSRFDWGARPPEELEAIEEGGPVVFYCKAFPRGTGGIPEEILAGDHNHEVESYPGDQGILFEEARDS